MLGNCIKSIKLPGVQWGEKFDKEPVAFGVNKLRCQAIIADSKQETQVIIDTIQVRCSPLPCARCAAPD